MQAVLGDIADVMHTRMSQGKSVHIKGLGYFRYVLDTVGVANLDDFDFEKQVKAVRVEFIPEREKTASGTYTRALVDSDDLEWIELSPDTKDDDPAQGGGDDGQDENHSDNLSVKKTSTRLAKPGGGIRKAGRVGKN